MMEQLLKFLLLLSGGRSYSIPELMERFEKSDRTIFRYLEELENVGFVIDKTKDSEKGLRYRLLMDHSDAKTLKKTFQFSEEEAWLLYRTLSDLKVSSSVQEKLLKKLNFLYDFKSISKLENTQTLEKINILHEGIRKKKKVRFMRYRSSNSGETKDRVVEAFEFMNEGADILCFDPDDNMNKQFRISRMHSAEIINEPWKNEPEHRIPYTDAFRMSGQKPIAEIEAKLSLKAYNLLIEEFPLAQKHIEKGEQAYHLKIAVASYHGIGRFVLGLPGEVEIIGCEDFKNYIKEQINLYD